jgi:outer membrane protein
MVKTHIKHSFIAATILVSVVCPVSAQLSAPYWTADIGFVDLTPDDKSGEISGPGLPPGNGVSVSSASSIVGSIAYVYSNNISFQVYIAPPIGFEVNAAGSLQGVGQLAHVDALLPTVLVNYTFEPIFDSVKTFVGLGLNYSTFFSEMPTPILNGALGGETHITLEDSLGLAFQAGLGIDLSDKWYLNVGYIWIDVDTTAQLTTAAIGTVRNVDVDIDPSGGYMRLGYRF